MSEKEVFPKQFIVLNWINTEIKSQKWNHKKTPLNEIPKMITKKVTRYSYSVVIQVKSLMHERSVQTEKEWERERNVVTKEM